MRGGRGRGGGGGEEEEEEEELVEAREARVEEEAGGAHATKAWRWKKSAPALIGVCRE